MILNQWHVARSTLQNNVVRALLIITSLFGFLDEPMSQHPAVIELSKHIDLTTNCGYISLLNCSAPIEQPINCREMDDVRHMFSDHFLTKLC